ncbi:LysR family transcriptional regulator [Eubacteriaceae bacterium ES2]|nr:LysR family transcriptional regulator [Eubacteriaceae bacterium ES2]
MLRISFQQIHYFLTVANVLNFTEAAEHLFISQPALSKQIKALEAELGLTLFKRNKRLVELTEEGSLLLQEWNIIERMISTSIDNAKRLNSQEIGQLNIGYTDTFVLDSILGKLISDFNKNHTDIDISFGSYGYRTMRQSFKAHELDLIFIPFFELCNYTDINYHHILTVDLSVAIPLSNPLSQRDNISVNDLSDEKFVMISPKESPKGVEKILQNCRDSGFEPKEIKYVNNLNSLILSLENGVGVTICHDNITDKNVRFYKLPIQPRDSDIMAVWKSGKKSKELDLIIQALKENFDHQ